MQAGMQWNILDNGLVENRSIARELEPENRVMQFRSISQRSRNDYIAKWESVTKAFNRKKLEILRIRREISTLIVPSLWHLQQLNLVTREDVLKAESRSAEIQALFAVYGNFNEYALDDPVLELLNADKLEPRALNYQTLFEGLGNASDSSLLLLQEIFNQQHHWTREVNAALFARYNLYDLTGTSPSLRSFVSVGVNLSAPIVFRKKEKDALQGLYLESEKSKITESLTAQNKQLATELYEYHYRLRQYIGLLSKRAYFMEILRQDIARYSVPGFSFNPVRALLTLDDLLSIDIEICDIRQNIVLRMLRILEYYRSGDPERVLQPINYKTQTVANITQQVYVWTSASRENTPKYLLEYPRFTHLSSPIVAVSPEDSLRTFRLRLSRMLTPAGTPYTLISSHMRSSHSLFLVNRRGNHHPY
jgi:hypothetical protein